MIIQFFDFLEQKVNDWYNMDISLYLKYEASFADFIAFKPESEKCTFKCNPQLCIYTFQNDKSDSVILLHRWLRLEKYFPLKTIAVLPVLLADGYELVPLLPIDVEIIETIQHGTKNINNIIQQIFFSRNTDETKSAYLANYIKEEINRLIKKEIITVTNN